MLPDMGKEGQPDQGETLVCPAMYADGLLILAVGYGDGASADGYGSPIWIEMCNDQLRALVWSDITHDDVDQIIDLEDAKTEHQKPSAWHKVTMHTPQGAVVSSFDYEEVEDIKEFIEEKPLPLNYYYLATEYETGKIVIDTRNKE